jgi:hypothetical protein
MPKLVARPILLVVAVGAAGYAARIYFIADLFFESGRHRRNSAVETASHKPKYKA